MDRAIVRGDRSALSTDGTGTKAAFHYRFDAVAPGESVTRAAAADGRADRRPARSSPRRPSSPTAAPTRTRSTTWSSRPGVPDEDRLVARRAFAGLLWTRQLYRYDVEEWLAGDPASPPPPSERLAPEPDGRNTSWRNVALADVISMPDEWEYPWFATWDLAFHAVALSHVDPAFAKSQLLLLCREWAQHPNGQLPAYEWAFSDVNPPVHAWAAWQVYLRDGAWDRDFLIRILTKLLLNVSWWVNRKDSEGSDLFEGGFLGMDNIGVFDRSKSVPKGWRLEQSDATAWIAFQCLQMMRIAQELGRHNHAFDDLATTFLERFLAIVRAMQSFGSQGVSLWDDEDGFFYDVLVGPHGETETMRVRSLVGLLPLLAVANCPPWVREELTDFDESLRWLERHRPDEVASLTTSHPGGRRRADLRGRRPDADDAVARPAARRGRVPVTARDPVALGRAPRRHHHRRGRHEHVDALHPGGVRHRPVRRELELARSGLVPAQRAAHQCAAHVCGGVGGRGDGRVPDGVG